MQTEHTSHDATDVLYIQKTTAPQEPVGSYLTSYMWPMMAESDFESFTIFTPFKYFSFSSTWL